jgi:hypothetical protein
MSKYFDNKDLFLEPKVNQYGSHMVMTNVHKPNKVKYINIDTKFSDEFNNGIFNEINDHTFTLPERLTNVKSIRVVSVELPMTFYNISASLGNNFFKVSYNSTYKMLVLDNGNYTVSSLSTAISNKISSLSLSHLSYTDVSGNDISGVYSNFTSDNQNASYTLNFDTDICGNFDKYNFRSKLGWLLGYRNQSYAITHGTDTKSESFINLYGTKYVYLVVDEFNNGVQNTFISPLYGSILNKKILARIAIDHPTFGTVLYSYENLGSLISDTRYYSGGKIDIQKLNVQIVNEYGFPVNFNGCDFSFVLQVVFD